MRPVGPISASAGIVHRISSIDSTDACAADCASECLTNCLRWGRWKGQRDDGRSGGRCSSAPMPYNRGGALPGSDMLRLGIDLGGTKIAGVALAPDGATLAERRIATPRHDYAATVDAIAGMVAWLEARAGGHDA